MMNNNKILTVSYGTFSCTLEGFEDSFGTMKVIAEYFRDLAADDRYFGAEPPQPDADTLARIAQTEVTRRVEAREQDGKIVLSALAGTTVAAASGVAAVQDAVMEEDEEPEAVEPEELTLEAQDAEIEEDAPVVEEVAADDAPVEAVSTDDLTDDVDDTLDDVTVVEDVAETVELEDVSAAQDIGDVEDVVAIEEVEAEEIAEEVETSELDTTVEDESAGTQSVEIEEVEAETDSVEIEETSQDDEEILEVEEPEEPASEELAAEAEDTSVVEESPVLQDAEPELTAVEHTVDVEAEADEAADDSADSTVEAAFEEDENDIVPGQSDDEVSAFFANSPAEDVAEVEPAAVADVEVPSADNPAPDSIAAKLQRIRAVVAQHEGHDETVDYVEDQHADGASQTEDSEADEAVAVADDAVEAEASDAMADAVADIEEALDIDATADAAVADAETANQTDADDIDAILSRLDAKADEVEAMDELRVNMSDDGLDDTSADDAIANTLEEDSVADSVNNIFDAEENAPADVADTAADAEADLAATAAAVAPSAASAEESEEQHARRVQTRRLKTRVIKVKRADLEAAIDKGDLEEYGAPAEEKAAADTAQGLDDLAPTKSGDTALSADQQDDLVRELAAVEEDIAREDQAETAKSSVTDEEDLDDEGLPRAVTSRRLLPNLDEKSGSAVSRLLVETDHQMDEPESATRRDAFAHLRAAVAAKKADDSINGNGADGDNNDAYREDLAEVVRPRRPVSGPPQTERPVEQKTAPLKLVAEQRIPSDEAPDEGPVQPRRVTSEIVAVSDDSAFAKFASDAGATTLPQLLEAAAAFMCFVEGREQFSRPQLMTKVREAGGQDGFSREDGLRSFGQLLRAGKIEKLKGGRFTVSDDIGFRPDERAFG